jgi:ABC-type sugar transport system ATPase subunit
MAQKREALKCIGVSAEDHVFGGLLDASFCLYRGETVVLSGLADSGKNTLIRILSGDIPKYQGKIFSLGQEVKLGNCSSIHDSGIACIGAIRRIFHNLSLRDNICLAKKAPGLFARLRFEEVEKDSVICSLAGELDIDVSRTSVDSLGSFEKAVLEIVKIYAGGARIIVIDIPALNCTGEEARRLVSIIRTLNTLGAAVILEDNEYFSFFETVVSRVIVLRRGLVAATFYKEHNGTFDVEKIRHAVTGRAFDRRPGFSELAVPKPSETPGLRILEKTGGQGYEIPRGTILGVLDMERKLPGTVEGLLAFTNEHYRVFLEGIPFSPETVRDLVAGGVAIISKESADQPIINNFSPVENVNLFAHPLFAGRFIYRRHIAEYIYDHVIGTYSVLRPCAALKNRRDCYGLSYERQYELMIAKWLAINPQVIVFYAPMSNDAKNLEHYKELHAALSLAGKTQIIISSSYEYLAETCLKTAEI